MLRNSHFFFFLVRTRNQIYLFAISDRGHKEESTVKSKVVLVGVYSGRRAQKAYLVNCDLKRTKEIMTPTEMSE